MVKTLWYLTLTSSIWLTYLGSFSSPVGSIYPFQILVLVMLLCIILRKKIKINKTVIFTIIVFTIFFTYGLASLIWTKQFSIGFNKIIQYLFGILFLFEFIILVDNKEKFLNSLYILAINYIGVLFVALLEIFSGLYFYATHYIQTFQLNFLNLNYPLVMFNNTNDLAVLLFMLHPLVIYVLRIKNANNKFISFIFIVIIFVIFNTESRLASVLILIYGILWPIIYLINKIGKTRIIRYLIIISLLFLVSVVTLIDLDILMKAINEVLNDGRVNIYSNALKLFFESYGIGLGIGGTYNTGNYGIMNVHNYLLELLFEFGLIIFFMYFIWLMYIFVKNIYAIRNVKIKEKIFLQYLNLHLFLLFIWGSISSTMTSRPHIWILYSIVTLTTYIFSERPKNKNIMEEVC